MQHPLVVEDERDQESPHTPVAVEERVDGLELRETRGPDRGWGRRLRTALTIRARAKSAPTAASRGTMVSATPFSAERMATSAGSPPAARSTVPPVDFHSPTEGFRRPPRRSRR